MDFKKINTLSGWFIFAIASIVYIMTVEPTVSFWDCGEFITSSYKLEVGHPPGAPFFMLIGRFFSMFAFGDATNVAYMINIMSALSSSFTILFLFWTITHLARRIVKSNGQEFDLSQTIAIIGSGAVGALAYTFSDTFWFSAVEGEVYAMSSLFTAVVFWAILKWEDVADQRYANRWLILIAYLMGLSIGVHLLNLLAIPAIALIYYFKKYQFSFSGLFVALSVAGGLLIGIMYIIIPGFVWGASRFELLFTNSFGLPYNSGTIFYILLIITAIIFGIKYTVKKKKVILNTIILGITVILIGYSSFALILIRSLAHPPMDQNSPENVFALQGYLNREQYGNRPLFFGEYFNSEVERTENAKPTYVQKNGKYEIIDYDIKRVYQDNSTTIFPRMYSDQPSHPEGYMQWTGITDKTKKPSFGENLKFFFKYQVNFMYFRYFLWNFVGRQSDIQTYGTVADGNWISGIPVIDNLRLGDQSLLPDSMQNNAGKNKYYFLPLLLGLFGIFFLLRENKLSKEYFWVVLLFFIMTGIAIIVYLNQTPYQPRERDYAYAGSFYSFAIYIGFAVLGIYKFLKEYISAKTTAILATAMSLLMAPVLMAVQNWDDHDRSLRYTARDFAYNYLNTCTENAIIFTNGDNDTFPLWYSQEVEGQRTDVRVINLSYLNTDWYIDQMKRRAYNSSPIPFSLTKDQYIEGTRDLMYVSENPNIFFTEKYNSNLPKYQPVYNELYKKMLDILSASEFAKLNEKDYTVIARGATALTPIQFSGLINELAKNENITKYQYSSEVINSLKTEVTNLVKNISEEYLPANLFMQFITSQAREDKILVGDEEVNYIPTNKIKIPVDKDKVISSGLVSEKDRDSILDYIEWDFKKSYVTKSELMVIDLLCTNNWERPIYFAITVGSGNYMSLEPYFQLDGMAYKFVPIKNSNSKGQKIGRVNSDILYENIMNKFKWGNIDNPNVYLDENNKRMLMNIKSNFARLAESLNNENKKDSAIAVLDKCVALIPNEKVAYNYYNLLIAEQYYRAGAVEKANEMINILAVNNLQDLVFYWSLSDSERATCSDDSEMSLGMIQEITNFLRKNEQTELEKQWIEKFAFAMRSHIEVIQKFDAMQDNQAALYQWYSTLPSIQQQIVSLYVSIITDPEETD